MAERISAVEFAQRFRTHFPDLGDHRKFYDTTMIAITGTPRIDPIALDDALQTPDGISMADYITQRYSPAAAAFVRSLI